MLVGFSLARLSKVLSRIHAQERHEGQCQTKKVVSKRLSLTVLFSF